MTAGSLVFVYIGEKMLKPPWFY